MFIVDILIAALNASPNNRKEFFVKGVKAEIKFELERNVSKDLRKKILNLFKGVK